MTEQKTLTGTYRELSDQLLALSPEYNHLEIVLKDLEQDAALRSVDGISSYTQLVENYELSRNTGRQKAYPETNIEIFGMAPEIGEPWKPCKITIKVDGHSYITDNDKEMWPVYFFDIKNRVKDLLEKGYVIDSFEVMKNQKDDFPGDLDADEILRANSRE